MPLKVVRKNLYGPRKAAIGEMNVTPFIDVLLVMLIMMILAIPVQTHVTPVDLPTGITPLEIRDTNVVTIDPSDQLYWNGEKVSGDQLRLQVATASERDKPAALRFEPNAQASYKVSAQVISLIRQEGATGFAFAGLAQHKDFGS
ncbi:MAG: biopolymer transporter ExbD [Erythrobacter sp.]